MGSLLGQVVCGPVYVAIAIRSPYVKQLYLDRCR